MLRPSVTSLALLTLSVTVNSSPVAQRSSHDLRDLICYEDNPLRALERFSITANKFCPGYLTAYGKGQTPKELTDFSSQELYSACLCYEKTASPSAGAPSTGSFGPTATGGSFAPFSPTSGTAPASTTPVPGPTSSASISDQSSPSPYAPATTSSIAPVDDGVASSTNADASVTLSPSLAAAATQASGSSVGSGSGSGTGSGSSAGPIKPGSKGKRGIAYDYNSPAGSSSLFKGSEYAVWGSNWGQTRTILDASFIYVPTIVVDKTLSNADWLTTIPGLIKSGSTTIFGSNEPDNAGQANLSPSDAAKVYQKYMQPFAGQAALGTPAVTNGGGSTGLQYLDDFATACTGCTFNFINLHFYLQRSDVDTVQFSQALKNHIDVNLPAVQAKHESLKGLPVMLGEFWLTGASDTEGANLLEDILPYLDGNDKVMGYQAFGGLWKGNFLNSAGTGLDAAGEKYNTYSAQATAAL